MKRNKNCCIVAVATRMKRYVTIVAVVLGIQVNLAAQDYYNTSYTRGEGFVLRPELYSGLFFSAGYQCNPYVQLTGGYGFGLDQYGGSVVSLGIRTYSSVAKWSPMFDYHIGFMSIQGMSLTRHTFIGGASYKDFDFGAGLMYITDGSVDAIGLSITLGYNIRCYKHR